MKVPQSEPYQRSRHRATLQAVVVAATAVASIGMPAKVIASPRDADSQLVATERSALHPVDAAKQVASTWMQALKQRDVAAALQMMRLPRESQNERDVIDEVSALSDWLSESGEAVKPIAAEQAGHWALSAWQIGEDAVLEPVTLYHPAPEVDDDRVGDWQVVPQDMQHDTALTPLYNADHASLMKWFEAL